MLARMSTTELRCWISSRSVGLPLLRLAMSVVRALKHRREVMRLSDLDDRTLKDIGLLRSDVTGALDEPFHKDPSRILVVRRIEHRVRTRPALVEERRHVPAPCGR
jgi:uncharacterized protein YjiS (DUF1127 family)